MTASHTHMLYSKSVHTNNGRPMTHAYYLLMLVAWATSPDVIMPLDQGPAQDDVPGDEGKSLRQEGLPPLCNVMVWPHGGVSLPLNQLSQTIGFFLFSCLWTGELVKGPVCLPQPYSLQL